MANKTSTTTREAIGRVGQRRQVVIPREICDTLKLREGDFVSFTRQKNGVFIKPKKLIDADDFLTPAKAKKVRGGMNQIKEGRFKLWRDVKHELGR